MPPKGQQRLQLVSFANLRSVPLPHRPTSLRGHSIALAVLTTCTSPPLYCSLLQLHIGHHSIRQLYNNWLVLLSTVTSLQTTRLLHRCAELMFLVTMIVSTLLSTCRATHLLAVCNIRAIWNR